MPRIAQRDPDVINICDEFKSAVGKTVLLLALPPLAVFFIKSISIAMFILLNWLIVVIIVPFVPYTKYHRRLKALKQEREWAPGAGREALIHLKAAAEVKAQTNTKLFIPAILVSAFPFVYELSAGLQETHFAILLSCGVMLLTTVFFYMVYRLVSRQRIEIIAADSKFNLALTKVRKHNWARF